MSSTQAGALVDLFRTKSAVLEFYFDFFFHVTDSLNLWKRGRTNAGCSETTTEKALKTSDAHKRYQEPKKRSTDTVSQRRPARSDEEVVASICESGRLECDGFCNSLAVWGNGGN